MVRRRLEARCTAGPLAMLCSALCVLCSVLWLLFAVHRQREAKRASLTHGAVDADRAAHLVNDRLRDEQTQAHSAKTPRAYDAFRLIEPAEDLCLLFGWYAYSPVLHRQRGGFAIAGQPDFHRAAVWRIFDSIAYQVGEHLLQTVLIAPHRYPILGQQQAKLMGWTCRLQFLSDVPCQSTKVDNALRRLQRAAFDPRNVEQVVHQPLHPPALRLNHVDDVLGPQLARFRG